MTQPNLGRKIADLRKAKGLTQEELVEKCNISVRTLQRIESGEGSPRSYTLRIIFDALDYSQVDSNEISSNSIGSIISFRLEQFYRYFIDLFNLKTNTMKKISILSIMLSTIILVLFLLTTESKAQKEEQAVKENTTKDSSNNGMTFAYFSCGGCFYDGDEIIARDIKFKISGVSVNFRLIKLNQKTREFNTGSLKGKFFLNKIEVTIAQDIINNGDVKYTAGKIEKTGDKIFLKGNAKFVLSQVDSIEADEIIITSI